MAKERTATKQKQHYWKIMQFSPIFVGDQYNGSLITYTSENQVYNMAHTLYKRKMENFDEETLKNEVLQQCINYKKA